MLKAVIFDMDGVVVDSNPFIRATWEAFLHSRGIILDDELFAGAISGKTGPDSIRILFNNSLPGEEVRSLVAQLNEAYRETIRNAPRLLPLAGITGFLAGLRASGIPIALATSAPPETIDLVLGRLGVREFFQHVVDDTQVTRGKPDPEIYRLAARRVGAGEAECIVFEDSRSGILAARGAGLTVIGVSTTHSPGELFQLGAEKVIGDFASLTVDELNELLEKSEKP